MFSHTKVAPSDLAALITTVASQLAKIRTKVEPPAKEKPKPAVSVRRSIRPDHLVCLVCGKPQKMLKRQLAVQHELTPPEYRELFGLKPDYPMAAPKYVERWREVALATRLGRPKKPARRGRKAAHGRGRLNKGGRPTTTLARDRVHYGRPHPTAGVSCARHCGGALSGRSDHALIQKRLEQPLPTSWEEQRARILDLKTS
jgi:predicted transcriptional regulator